MAKVKEEPVAKEDLPEQTGFLTVNETRALEADTPKAPNPTARAIREVVACLRLIGGLNDKALEVQLRNALDCLEKRAKAIEGE